MFHFSYDGACLRERKGQTMGLPSFKQSDVEILNALKFYHIF
jgi:hypothetical protein